MCSEASLLAASLDSDLYRDALLPSPASISVSKEPFAKSRYLLDQEKVHVGIKTVLIRNQGNDKILYKGAESTKCVVDYTLAF